MNSRNIVNGLAVLGALLVILGVSAAASSAFAAPPVTHASALSGHGNATSRSVDLASMANTEAADAAVLRMADELQLELEFRLSAHSSRFMAWRY